MASTNPVLCQQRAFRGRVVTPTAVIDGGAVVIEGDRIVFVGTYDEACARFGSLVGQLVELADDAVILPGLVDIHNHGGGGASFPDVASADEAMTAVLEHRRHGTTTLVASLVTADRETLLRRAATLGELGEAGELAGIHLEGPFLSADRCGAQNPTDMLAGDPGLVRAIAKASRGHFVTMTVAPEVPGIVGPGGVIETLIEVGALPSIGHTDCSVAQVEVAVDCAAAALDAAGRPEARITATHLFNGMRPVHHRDPGPILGCLAAAARGRLVVELIGDGTHLDPATVRSVIDLVGTDGHGVGRDAVVFVTDAMAAAGLPDGPYQLGPMSVTVADGVARLTEGGAIAGGTAHLLDIVRTSVAGGVPLVAAVRAASATPAAVLGLDDVGGLVAGYRADVLVVDAHLRPVRVLRAGVEIEL